MNNFSRAKLTEYIDKCFVGESSSNVRYCIRSPVFVPVKREGVSRDIYVIEVDIEPWIALSEGKIFEVSFKCLHRGKDRVVAYKRHGSKTALMQFSNLNDTQAKTSSRIR